MEKKKSNNTAFTVSELAKPLCDELSLELWDVRFEKEGASWYLRVFIDKDGGINIDDCEAFSRPFNKILDEVDPISVPYVFEVSGPGLGRELKKPEHFDKFIGEKIRARFIREKDGEKEVSGILKSYENKTFVISLENEDKTINISDCAYVKVCDDEDLI